MASVGLPTFERFPVHSEENTVGLRWCRWTAKLENLMCALNITDDARKTALLLHYAGDEVYEIYEAFTAEQKGVGATLPGPNEGDPAVLNAYSTLNKSFTTYFTPKQNTSFEVFKFRQTIQKPSEAIDAFHTRLLNLATHCDFHDTDTEILAQIVQGCVSNRLRRKALKDNITLQAVLDEARALELSETRAAEIEGACADVSSAVNAVGSHRGRGRGRHSGPGSHSVVVPAMVVPTSAVVVVAMPAPASQDVKVVTGVCCGRLSKTFFFYPMARPLLRGGFL